MDLNDSAAVAVADVTDVATARRAAVELAGHLHFPEVETGKVALVVTEAATNIIKHGGGGEIVLLPLHERQIAGIALLALDRGRGMDFASCLRDGYSTAGSPGTGLGAIRRVSSRLEVHSGPALGTALLAEIWPGPPPDADGSGLLVSAICVPQPGERVCGDAWWTERDLDRTTIVVADGLGHGPDARAAATAAIDAFRAHRTLQPAALIERMHEALRPTRGAAVAVLRVAPDKGVVTFAGLGNVAAAVIDGATVRRMASHNGTLGREMRRVREFTYPWTKQSVLILHSDGLGTRWDLDAYPGLASRHPSLIGGVLYRDFSRRRDDVTVVVAKPA